MTVRRAGGWLVLALLVAGCGSVPPVPPERFYRLPPPAARVPLEPPPRLERVTAPGPLRERPLLFTRDERGLVLEQQHYHSWVAPPPELVRRRLLACLGGDGTQAGEGRAAGRWRLWVHLERFERVLAGERGSVAVAMTVTADDATRQWTRRYQRVTPVAGDGVPAAVPVFAAALDAICAELAADLAGGSGAVR